MQLHHSEAEFRRLGVQVLLISFGAEHWARAWLQETGSPFPLLLGPERAAYQSYGLNSSIIRVWSLKVMWHYAKLALAGEQLRPIHDRAWPAGGQHVSCAAAG